MIGPLHIEVALAVGYAGFLMVVACRIGMVRTSFASAFGAIPHGWLQISRPPGCLGQAPAASIDPASALSRPSARGRRAGSGTRPHL